MKSAEFLNYTVAAALGVKEVKGPKFGLELELEGRAVALADVATKGWNRVMDGSLRGEAIEYTTAGAKDLEETRVLVNNLFKKFKTNGVKFNNSIRTSTHVHLNFSDRKIKTVINFFSLFTLLEEVLQYYSGEDRKGNLFCISTREAEGIVGILAHAVATCNLAKFAGDRFKYAACNLSTLYKFGTVEVRTMRGASSAEQVISWVELLNDLYEYAEKMRSPVQLVNDLSHLGAEALMRQIFSPKNYAELIQYFPAVQTLHYSLMEGARLIQVFAYEFDDAFNAKVNIKAPVVGAGDLPVKLQEGPFKGNLYRIYKPDGRVWNCRPEHRAGPRPLFWRDGLAVADDPNIKWSSGFQRFVYYYPNGDAVLCNWAIHHAIPDEGPPLARRELAGRPRGRAIDDMEFDEPEEDFEPDFDEEGDEE